MNDFVIENGVLKKYNGTVPNVEIPDGVTIVGAECFFNCDFIESVKIPATVDTIEKFAFMGCTSLQEIEIPERVTYIGQGAFCNCERLKRACLPDLLETLCVRAFEGCSSLASVNIPKALESIPASCFQLCTSLESISFPETLKGIKMGAFYGCDALDNVTVPKEVSFHNEWVTQYKLGAFEWCKRLKSLTLLCPADALDTKCFAECKNLREVSVPAEYASNNVAWWKERFSSEAFDVIALANFDKDALLTKFVVKDRIKCIKSLIAKDRLDLIHKVFEYSSKPSAKVFETILEEIRSTGSTEAVAILLECKK